MNGISPHDMERYRARLARSSLSASAKDEAICALHLMLTAIFDAEYGQSATDLAIESRLKDSFQSSVSHANLLKGPEPKIVDLAADQRREGASNKPKKHQGYAP